MQFLRIQFQASAQSADRCLQTTKNINTHEFDQNMIKMRNPRKPGSSINLFWYFGF